MGIHCGEGHSRHREQRTCREAAALGGGSGCCGGITMAQKSIAEMRRDISKELSGFSQTRWRVSFAKSLRKWEGCEEHRDGMGEGVCGDPDRSGQTRTGVPNAQQITGCALDGCVSYSLRLFACGRARADWLAEQSAQCRDAQCEGPGRAGRAASDGALAVFCLMLSEGVLVLREARIRPTWLLRSQSQPAAAYSRHAGRRRRSQRSAVPGGA